MYRSVAATTRPAASRTGVARVRKGRNEPSAAVVPSGQLGKDNDQLKDVIGRAWVDMGMVTAGDVVRVTLRLPAEITGVMSGLILFFLIGSEPLLRYRWRRETRPIPAPAPQPAREGSD